MHPALVALAGSVTVAFLLSWAVEALTPRRRLLRAMKKQPVTPIAQARSGQRVRVRGQARALGSPLIAPLTGHVCVYYRVLIEKRVKDGKYTVWRAAFTEEKVAPFAVDDGHDRLPVRGDRLTTVLATDGLSRSGTFDNPTAEERALLARAGLEATGFLGFNRALRYREWAVEVDSAISVMGQAVEGYDGTLELGAPADDAIAMSDDRALLRSA